MGATAQLARIPKSNIVRLVVANNAGDGSGTIATLLTISGKTVRVINLSAAALVTVPNWSRMSNDKLGNICNGDVVQLVAGTVLTGIALNTEYTISRLGVDGSDNATFELLDSTYAVLTITATNPVFEFAIGGRVETVVFTPAIATKAVYAAKVGAVYFRPRGGSYRKVAGGEVAITAATPSATVIATSFTCTIAQAFGVGDIGVAITVRATAVDDTDVQSFNSLF